MTISENSFSFKSGSYHNPEPQSGRTSKVKLCLAGSSGHDIFLKGDMNNAIASGRIFPMVPAFYNPQEASEAIPNIRPRQTLSGSIGIPPSKKKQWPAQHRHTSLSARAMGDQILKRVLFECIKDRWKEQTRYGNLSSQASAVDKRTRYYYCESLCSFLRTFIHEFTRFKR